MPTTEQRLESLEKEVKNLRRRLDRVEGVEVVQPNRANTMRGDPQHKDFRERNELGTNAAEPPEEVEQPSSSPNPGESDDNVMKGGNY